MHKAYKYIKVPTCADTAHVAQQDERCASKEEDTIQDRHDEEIDDAAA